MPSSESPEMYCLEPFYLDLGASPLDLFSQASSLVISFHGAQKSYSVPTIKPLQISPKLVFTKSPTSNSFRQRISLFPSCKVWLFLQRAESRIMKQISGKILAQVRKSYTIHTSYNNPARKQQMSRKVSKQPKQHPNIQFQRPSLLSFHPSIENPIGENKRSQLS